MYFETKATAARLAAPAAKAPLVPDSEVNTAEKFQHRVEHALCYFENRSLSFDLYILARTTLLRTENVH